MAAVAPVPRGKIAWVKILQETPCLGAGSCQRMPAVSLARVLAKCPDLSPEPVGQPGPRWSAERRSKKKALIGCQQ